MAKGCPFQLKVAFAAIGIFVGFSIFFTFGMVYHNIHTAIWGALSGVYATFALALHIQYRKDKWDGKGRTLLAFIGVGIFGQIASIAAFGTYLIIAIVEKQALTPHGSRAFYLACVWAAMTWKWAFVTTLYGITYRRQTACPLSVRESDSLLGNENPQV